MRNAAFHSALKRAIVPGKSVVLDIGSGTGFLSFLSERLGAKECWLVESGDVATLAEAIARDNGMKRCSFVHAHSADIPLPKADVIVSETLGNYALEEGIIGTMNEARAYLKKGGSLIPASLRQFACPVVRPRIQRSIDAWDVGYDLDLGAARRVSLQNMYVKTLRPADLLRGGKAAKEWDAIDFRRDNADVREATVAWKAATPFTAHGMALWWHASLDPRTAVTTSPLAPTTHWEQIYLPLLEPARVARGETLRVSLHSDTRPDVRIRMRWTVRVLAGKTVRHSQECDTQAGLI